MKINDHVKIILKENNSSIHIEITVYCLYFLLHTLGRLQHVMLLKTKISQERAKADYILL